MMKLYHCTREHSMRPLLTLEDMGLEYELETIPFMPRYLHKEYLAVNPLGAVPAFVHGGTAATPTAPC